MSLLNLVRVSVGAVGVKPGKLKMLSTSDLTTITTAGYLNGVGGQLPPLDVAPSDIIECLYSYNLSTDVGTYVVLSVSIHNGVITLSDAGGEAGYGTINQVASYLANGTNVSGVSILKDASSLNSLDWMNRLLIANDGTTVNADWANPLGFAFNGVLITGSPVSGYVLTATSPTAAHWAPLSGGLGGLGVHSSTSTGSFATASTIITDAAITPSDVVIARFVSSANVVTTQTVLPGNGQFTIVTDTAPSTGVLEYISYTPSSALIAAGVVAGKGSYGGGSATFVIADANVTAGMVVNANFQSQVTPSRIYTVLAGAGTLTFVCSANPGVCVMEYVAIAPSSQLTSEGLEAVNYSYAGGFASIVISDANITATSIVTADFKSQSVVALIQKVTPSAGTLTILASIDPGVSVVAYTATSGAVGGASLISTNNLSDVASASASLANLGGLPLAGGQMTGELLLDRGTATSTAGAATINHQAGVVTTESLTTASGAAYAFTLTNSRIASTSIVLCQLLGGTNTKHGLSFTAVPGAGSAAISILNNDISAAALNGTLIFGFEVI